MMFRATYKLFIYFEIKSAVHCVITTFVEVFSFNSLVIFMVNIYYYMELIDNFRW